MHRALVAGLLLTLPLGGRPWAVARAQTPPPGPQQPIPATPSPDATSPAMSTPALTTPDQPTSPDAPTTAASEVRVPPSLNVLRYRWLAARSGGFGVQD